MKAYLDVTQIDTFLNALYEIAERIFQVPGVMLVETLDFNIRVTIEIHTDTQGEQIKALIQQVPGVLQVSEKQIVGYSSDRQQMSPLD